MAQTAKNIQFKFESEVFGPSFLPYISDESFIQLFTGNRGSGKTKFLLQRAIIFALNKKYFKLLYGRKVSRNVRDTLFSGFKSIITEWDLKRFFTIKETEMDIICRLNGNELLSFGLDDPDKLKGVDDPTHVLWDEMTEGDFQDYASLIGLLRTTKAKTQFWGTFNPEYGFWGRDYFFKDNESDEIPIGVVPSKLESVLIFKATFKDNPFIDSAEYEKKLLDLASGDENKLTVWIDGNWGQLVTGNEFYPPFKKSVHVMRVPFVPYNAIHLTYDFNVLPYMTELAGQVIITDTEFQIRIFKEYCLKSPLNSTESVCKAFLDDYLEDITDLFYYGDASGQNRIAGKGNVTAFDDVRKALDNYLTDASKRLLKRNPPILKRRDFINNILLGKVTYMGLKVVLMIDESCVELIKDMRQLKMGINGKLKKRKTDKATGLSWEELGHTSDALEYLIIKLLYDIFKTK